MVDDMLNLGIIATGNGFYPLNLTNNTLGTVIPTTGANADEAVGVNFGYDMAHHRVLSANYTVNPQNNFASSPAHFQIIDLSTPASPVTYELANNQAFFLQVSRTCTGTGGRYTESICRAAFWYELKDGICPVQRQFQHVARRDLHPEHCGYDQWQLRLREWCLPDHCGQQRHIQREQ